MKKNCLIISLVVLFVIVLGLSFSIAIIKFTKEKEHIPVELEIINPITGEVVKKGDMLGLPEEKLEVEVRIKNGHTGEYLTDNDLPNGIKGSSVVDFDTYNDVGKDRYPAVYSTGYWPERFDDGRINYDIIINFDEVITSDYVYDSKEETLQVEVYNYSAAEIELDELTDIYVMPEKEREIVFEAPQNGTYVIETFGNIKNKINSQKGTLQDKSDKINQALTVSLKAREIFEFSTTNLSSKDGIYQIKAEFTPTEIKLGETKSLTIAPGEIEYFAYYPKSSLGFNFELSEVGDYYVSLYCEDVSHFPADGKAMHKTHFAVNWCVKDEKYLLGISNYESTVKTIDITLSPPTELKTGEINNLTIGFGRFYEFTTGEYEGIRKLSINSTAPIKAILYDENINRIYESQKSAEEILIQPNLSANKKYYLYLESNNYYNVDTELTIN